MIAASGAPGGCLYNCSRIAADRRPAVLATSWRLVGRRREQEAKPGRNPPAAAITLARLSDKLHRGSAALRHRSSRHRDLARRDTIRLAFSAIKAHVSGIIGQSTQAPVTEGA